MLKVVVYLPLESLDSIQNAIKDYCCSYTDKYTHCMSWRRVKSMWMPINDANPYLGTVGKDEQAEEYELTFRCKEEDVQEVIRLIKENHPYEDVCIDVCELKQY